MQAHKLPPVGDEVDLAAGEDDGAMPPRQPRSFRKSAKTVITVLSISDPSSGLNRNEDAAPTPLTNT